jgi:hypothetical protein
VLLLIAGGLCLWRHTINKKKKTLRDIVNPRGDEDRSDAGGATYAKTLLSDESTTRYSAIPGWVNAIEMNDRLSVAHSESNFSGTTYPGGPNP